MSRWMSQITSWGALTRRVLRAGALLGAFTVVSGLALAGPAAAETPGVLLVDSYSVSGLGDTRTVSSSTRDLSSIGFDDKTSALQVRGDIAVAVYSDVNYGGTCETFVGTEIDLTDHPIGDNRISSVKVNHTCNGWLPGPAVIHDVKTVIGDSSSVSCPDGYTKKPENLNEGAGGKRVYACVLWGPRRSGVALPWNMEVTSDLSETTAKLGCADYDDFKARLVDGDLNAGAGGMFMYFCLFSSPAAGPTTTLLHDIDFVVRDSDPFGPFTDFQAVTDEMCSSKMGVTDARGSHLDLNTFAGGKYIYLCFTRVRDVPFASDVDTTPPTITLDSVAPPANANGWHRGHVTVTWTCSDGESGARFDRVTWQLSTEGRDQEAFGRCQDEAGNVSTDTVTGIDIDNTAPAITRTGRTPANAAGWNREPVTVTWSCSDALSGPESTVDSVTVSTEGAGQSAIGRCADLAGNSASDTVGEINIDTTPPVVSWTGGAQVYDLLETVELTCTATDALSGIATTTCRDVSAPAWSFGPGPASLTATAADRAANTTSATASFAVTATTDSLCQLTRRFLAATAPTPARARPLGVSLCTKLDHVVEARTAGARSAAVRSYVHEVRAAAGRWFTTAQAATLKSFAQTLQRRAASSAGASYPRPRVRTALDAA